MTIKTTNESDVKLRECLHCGTVPNIRLTYETCEDVDTLCQVEDCVFNGIVMSVDKWNAPTHTDHLLELAAEALKYANWELYDRLHADHSQEQLDEITKPIEAALLTLQQHLGKE